MGFFVAPPQILHVKMESNRKKQLSLPKKPILIPDISFHSPFSRLPQIQHKLWKTLAYLFVWNNCALFFFVLILLTAAFQQLRKNLGLLYVNYCTACLLLPPCVCPDPVLLHHKNTANYTTEAALLQKRFYTQRSLSSNCSILSRGNLTSVGAEISGHELHSTGTPTEILCSRSRQWSPANRVLWEYWHHNWEVLTSASI